MKSLGLVRKTSFVLAVLSLAVAQTSPPQNMILPVGSATVAEMKGNVSIQSPQGAPIAGQRGAVLPAGTTIEVAKGSMLLDLQDGSQVLVKSHSRVVLQDPGQNKGNFLELLIGKIVAKVQKRLQNAPSFRMGTPTAVITVRGTRFSVDVDKKQKTLVEVYEGLVEVQSLQVQGPPVLLKPGFETGVDRDRAPSQPRPMDEGFGSQSQRDDNNGPGRYGNDREGQSAGHDGQSQGSQSEHEQPDKGPN